MYWLVLFTFLFQAFAQDTPKETNQNGDRIYNSICSKNSDCLDYLICKKKKCVPYKPPSAEKCGQLSYVHRTKSGKTITQCPPACGFEQDLVYGPRCVNNAEGCLASVECRQNGNCTFNGQNCVPDEEGCSNSSDCKTKGLCGFDGERCVPSFEGCSASTQCKQQGYCTYIAGPKDWEASHGRCEKDVTGCIKSDFCTVYGQCGFANGSCIATVMGCANSQICKKDGLCRYKEYVGCVK